MDSRLMKLMALKKKGDKTLSDSDVSAKKAALGDLIGMAKDAMGEKVKGLKKVTVASDSTEGLNKGLELAKKKLGEMKASDESEVAKTGHDEEAEMESPEEEAMEGEEGEAKEEKESSLENLSEEELMALMKKAQEALSKKKA